MDLQSRVRWEDYTKAKEEMFARTNIPEAPWYIVEGNDKKRARLNCMDHFVKQIPYTDVPNEDVSLPNGCSIPTMSERCCRRNSTCRRNTDGGQARRIAGHLVISTRVNTREAHETRYPRPNTGLRI